MKPPLEERTQDEPKHFLSNPVADGGDPQRACLVRTFGDVCDTPQGEGLEGTSRLQVAHQGEQVRFEVGLEHPDAHLVDPRRTAVPSHVAKGAVHEFRGDPSRQRVVLDLGHGWPFPAETHETETSGQTPPPARGGCCLVSAAWSAERCGRPMVGLTRPANCPRGSSSSSSLAHGSSFHLIGYSGAAAIPEAGAVGAVPRTAASPARFGILIGRVYPGCPETAWDFHRSVWSTIVSRRNHQSPCRVAATNRNGCREERRVTPRCFGRLRSLAPRLGPKRGSSRTVLAWPLRQRPLPTAAGCVPFRGESSSKDFRTGTAPRG